MLKAPDERSLLTRTLRLIGTVFFLVFLPVMTFMVYIMGFDNFRGYGVEPEAILYGLLRERPSLGFETTLWASSAMLLSLLTYYLVFKSLWQFGSLTGAVGARMKQKLLVK